jgi:hypothetical protein
MPLYDNKTHELVLGPGLGSGSRVQGLILNLEPYLTESVHKVVLKKSIPAQIRQLILYNDYCEA